MAAQSFGSTIKNGDFFHIAINTNEDYFRHVFSKMEYIMAYEYLENLMGRLSINSYRISVPDKIYRGNDMGFKNYLNERKNIFSKQPLNRLEEDFMERFRKFEIQKLPEIKLNRMSVWSEDKAMKLFEKEDKAHILITGFNTDNEIFINATNSSDMGFVPIVLSDGVSAPSERNHFNALEFMSKFTYMVDSRDLMIMAGEL
ncbi:MAG: isochorismatase family protein [Candidatus Thermoplasmatota archaeon]|nr:isochorismatase family protein [Candidatus Thermoplasmatota archaeon]MCL5889234.1 isochorismatase family protein [Candidatus Thermoplasmatota archaeon]